MYTAFSCAINAKRKTTPWILVCVLVQHSECLPRGVARSSRQVDSSSLQALAERGRGVRNIIGEANSDLDRDAPAPTHGAWSHPGAGPAAP